MPNDVQKEIDRLVKKYPWPDSSSLFSAELEGLAEIAMAEGEKTFKQSVVAYALDELEKDCLSGPGLSEDVASVIERLRYWILEKEVKDRNAGEAIQKGNHEE